MPNSAAASTLVVSAAKCRARGTAAFASKLPPCARNQSRAAWALTMVSAVVKVLDATRNSVCSGCSWRSRLPSSMPSTLETKCTRLPGIQRSSSADTTMAGPRPEPPMPMLTMSVMRSSARTASAYCSMEANTACTSWLAFAIKSVASGACCAYVTAGFLNKWCSTARCSVVLMAAPAHMASRCASRPHSRASAISNASVVASRRLRDRSANTCGASWLSAP